jgi:hypothetical protein
MRVIVTGSRNWGGVYGADRIHKVLEALHILATVLGQKLVLVHGDGLGADHIVDGWARRRDSDGVEVETFPANWGMYKKYAGPIRNQAMVDRGADLCIGFCRGTSAGTRHTMALARNADIPTYVINWEETIE